MIVVLDFDSTFIQDETIDVLAQSSGAGVQKRIAEVTEQAMRGELAFDQALITRISLLRLSKEKLQQAIDELIQRISPSIIANKEIIKNNADSIYIVSGGFVEVILPIVKSFGIAAKNVFANELLWDQHGMLCGVNEKNPLAKRQGKVHVVSTLQLADDVIVIGDGYTDFEVKQAGVAREFWAYSENVYREQVVALADREVKDFNECSKLLGWN